MHLTEALARWREISPRTPGTKRRHGYAIRRLEGAGLVVLDDLTPARLADYVRAGLARGLAPDTLKLDLAGLFAVLGQLVREGRYKSETLNALRCSAPERRRGRRRRARFLLRTEVERLAEAATIVSPRLELPIRVAALTGCRISELARLSVEDFTLGDRPDLRIVSLPDFGEQGAIKTGEPRTIPVCRELKDLVAQRCPPAGWLFPTLERRSGRRASTPFVSRGTLERELYFTRRVARLPEDVTFTTLRHTRASWWVQAGVSIYKVADWLGHDVRVCERFYAALQDGYDPDCERMPA